MSELKGESQEPKDQPAEHMAEKDQETEHSTADYASYEKPEKNRNPIWRKLFIILGILVLLAGLGSGAYWYWKNHKSSKEPANTNQATQQTEAPTGSITATTKHYDSPNFYLGIDYPEDWTVTDNGGGIMTIISPATQLKSADGQTITGKISLNIRGKVQKMPEFDAGNATAVIASEKISYTKPTQNQRGSTYISFLRYASTANTAGLDGVYVTSDNGYTVGQAIPGVDIAKVDPGVSITFGKCVDNNCSSYTAPLTVAATAWADKSFSSSLEAILKSLTIT